MLAHSPRVVRFALGVLASLGAVGVPPGAAVAQIPISAYQADLGAPATSVAQALTMRPQRMTAALEAQACGNEVRFLADAQARATGEDVVSVLVAKVGWLRLGARSCTFHVEFPLSAGFDKDAFNTTFAAFYGTDCAQPVTFAVLEPASEIERSEGILGGPRRTRRVRDDMRNATFSGVGALSALRALWR